MHLYKSSTHIFPERYPIHNGTIFLLAIKDRSHLCLSLFTDVCSDAPLDGRHPLNNIQLSKHPLPGLQSICTSACCQWCHCGGMSFPAPHTVQHYSQSSNSSLTSYALKLQNKTSLLCTVQHFRTKRQIDPGRQREEIERENE